MWPTMNWMTVSASPLRKRSFMLVPCHEFMRLHQESVGSISWMLAAMSILADLVANRRMMNVKTKLQQVTLRASAPASERSCSFSWPLQYKHFPFFFHKAKTESTWEWTCSEKEKDGKKLDQTTWRGFYMQKPWVWMRCLYGGWHHPMTCGPLAILQLPKTLGSGRTSRSSSSCAATRSG